MESAKHNKQGYFKSVNKISDILRGAKKFIRNQLFLEKEYMYKIIFV